MSDFIPFVYQAATPRTPIGGSAAAAPASGPTSTDSSVIVPYCREIDLLTMGAVPGAEYEKDFFLFHAVECSFQSLILSCATAVAQTNFSFSLIEKINQEVTTLIEPKRLGVLPVTPAVYDDPTAFQGGAVFLRLNTLAQNATLLVTIETLTSEVM